ncbi:hypothetical protein RUM43_005114 [Polyplax serrata]|uniref:Uncharacterized protein n=1 Tax=Polyplax serrata TaxID=468196 RepID=A0AAN8SCL1_POLSC
MNGQVLERVSNARELGWEALPEEEMPQSVKQTEIPERKLSSDFKHRNLRLERHTKGVQKRSKLHLTSVTREELDGKTRKDKMECCGMHKERSLRACPSFRPLHACACVYLRPRKNGKYFNKESKVAKNFN